jgi:hypothetical protein
MDEMIIVTETLAANMSKCTTVRLRRCELDFCRLRMCSDRLCGLVVRVLGYRSGGPGSIPGTTRKEK